MTLECRMYKERGSNSGRDDLYKLTFSMVFIVLLKQNLGLTANHIGDLHYFELVSLIIAWSGLSVWDKGPVNYITSLRPTQKMLSRIQENCFPFLPSLRKEKCFILIHQMERARYSLKLFLPTLLITWPSGKSQHVFLSWHGLSILCLKNLWAWGMGGWLPDALVKYLNYSSCH